MLDDSAFVTPDTARPLVARTPASDGSVSGRHRLELSSSRGQRVAAAASSSWRTPGSLMLDTFGGVAKQKFGMKDGNAVVLGHSA